MVAQCIWLDGAVVKACRVLRARLAPLGYRVKCGSWMHDRTIEHVARMLGCVVVSSDRAPEPTDVPPRVPWIYVPPWLPGRKSARDLATHILKLVGLYATGSPPPAHP